MLYYQHTVMSINSNNYIEFHFPSKETDAGKLIDSLILSVSRNKHVSHAGFSSPEDFRDDLEWRYENALTEKYEPIKHNRKEGLQNIVETTLEKSRSKLPASNQEITILVFPWLPPFDEFDKQMGYVSGFAAGNNTINIYLEPKKLSEEFLMATVAHEYNHLVFFNHHTELDPDLPDTKATILDVLIWEGLAENFSELVVGKKVSPIISNLTEPEAREELEKIKNENRLRAKIADEDDASYQNIFFGADGTYKRWAGYSIGYFVVKAFLNNQTKISWEKIMKMDPENIFSRSLFADK